MPGKGFGTGWCRAGPPRRARSSHKTTGQRHTHRERNGPAVHPRGIEHCDLLGPGDEFVHVKLLRGSDDASHLFAQVHVAVEQLLYDAEGRRALADKIAARSGGSRTAPESPTKIGLAIGGRGKLRVDDLFTFSQVTLVRLSQHLENRGIQVEVIAIPPS